MRGARVLRIGLAILAGTITLLGCQQAPPSGGQGSPSPVAQQAPATQVPPAPKATEGPQGPKRGGTFVFTITSDPPTLNPALSTGLIEQTAGCVPYQGLVFIDNKYNIQPFLAESWQVTPDNLTYTFKLRQGVKWHDGKPFTADDVKFTFEQVLAKYHPRSKELFSQIVGSVQTPDPYTIKVVLKEMYGPFLSQLNCWNAAILPKHIFEGTDIPTNPHNTKDIVGTGAFKVESWVPGDRITYVRNDQYWAPGEPYLDRIIFKIITEPAARTAALEAGEVDYIQSQSLSVQDYIRLKDDRRFQVGLGTNLPVDQMLTPNVQNAPLNDKRVRQALYLATDRDTIDKQVFFQLGQVSKSSVTSDLGWAYNPAVDLSKQYAFDLQKANQLLDAAGFPRGSDGNRFRRLKFIYEVGRTGFAEISQIVQQNWAAIGVPIEIVPLERSVMIDTVYVKRQFDVNVNQLGTNGDPALGYPRLYTCDSIRPIQFTNGAGYCNPEVDRLFRLGASQAENAQRAPYYFELQKLLAEEVPILPLRQIGFADLGSAKFEFKTTMWTAGQITDLWGKIYLKTQ